MDNKHSERSAIEKLQQKARKLMYYNTTIQIIDNERAIVENCRHIVECNDILVKLATADFQIDIWGQELTISDYNKESVIINGRISSVELTPRRKAGKNAL